jgi:hypothetical protein
MTVKGSCHCGAAQFTIANQPATVTRCTCSFCSKRGALWAYQDNEDNFVLTTARDRVSTYQWGSDQIEHHHSDLRLRHVTALTPMGSENKASCTRKVQSGERVATGRIRCRSAAN